MLPSSNTLLAALPESEYQLLTLHMKLVSLQKGQVLFDADEVPSHVYYPVGAIVSMLKEHSDGRILEIHFLGATCMVGVGALEEPSFYKAIVRTPGLAYKLRTTDLLMAKPKCPVYQQRDAQLNNAVLAETSAGLACAAHHPASQQFIRWLLRSFDRSLEPVIPLTHQEIANLLGFRRETITLIVSGLTELGCIITRRGVIELLDRQKLEERVCECYPIAHQPSDLDKRYH